MPRRATPQNREEETNRRDGDGIIASKLAAYRARMPLPDATWSWQVRALLHCLNERLYEDDLTIEDAMQRCGVRKNISVRFRWRLGVAPKQYVMQHRVEAAKRLLRYERLSVGRVAFSVGFATTQALTMAFQRIEGCSPSAHRAFVKEKREERCEREREKKA